MTEDEQGVLVATGIGTRAAVGKAVDAHRFVGAEVAEVNDAIVVAVQLHRGTTGVVHQVAESGLCTGTEVRGVPGGVVTKAILILIDVLGGVLREGFVDPSVTVVVRTTEAIDVVEQGGKRGSCLFWAGIWRAAAGLISVAITVGVVPLRRVQGEGVTGLVEAPSIRAFVPRRRAEEAVTVKVLIEGGFVEASSGIDGLPRWRGRAGVVGVYNAVTVAITLI